jgi:septation ring formation regulator EzrA
LMPCGDIFCAGDNACWRYTHATSSELRERLAKAKADADAARATSTTLEESARRVSTEVNDIEAQIADAEKHLAALRAVHADVTARHGAVQAQQRSTAVVSAAVSSNLAGIERLLGLVEQRERKADEERQRRRQLFEKKLAESQAEWSTMIEDANSVIEGDTLKYKIAYVPSRSLASSL